jgi:hypothetical protein
MLPSAPRSQAISSGWLISVLVSRVSRPGNDRGVVSYRRGMVPVTARIGGTRWRTSLFPKDGRYVVTVRTGVRKAEGLDVGDVVTVRLTVDV